MRLQHDSNDGNGRRDGDTTAMECDDDDNGWRDSNKDGDGDGDSNGDSGGDGDGRHNGGGNGRHNGNATATTAMDGTMATQRR